MAHFPWLASVWGNFHQIDWGAEYMYAAVEKMGSGSRTIGRWGWMGQVIAIVGFYSLMSKCLELCAPDVNDDDDDNTHDDDVKRCKLHVHCVLKVSAAWRTQILSHVKVVYI